MNGTNGKFEKAINNPYFIGLASIAGILGFIVSLSIFFPPGKRPLYAIKSFNLINDSSSEINNLDIKYNFCNDNKTVCELKPIERITVTKILFWNAGREKIDKTDVDDNPITIQASNNNKILESKLIHVANEKTNFKLDKSKNAISFSFLDTRNGGVIEVIHTGKSDEDIYLDGYVEDSIFNGQIKKEYFTTEAIIVIAAIVIVTTFCFVYLLIFITLQELTKITSTNKRLFDFSIMIFAILMTVSLTFFTSAYPDFLRKKYMNYPVKSYEVFNSEISE